MQSLAAVGPWTANSTVMALESPANRLQVGWWGQGHPFSHGCSNKDMHSFPYGCPAAPALPHPPGHIQHSAPSHWDTFLLLCPSGRLHPTVFILLLGHLHPIIFVLLHPLEHLHPVASPCRIHGDKNCSCHEAGGFCMALYHCVVYSGPGPC